MVGIPYVADFNLPAAALQQRAASGSASMNWPTFLRTRGLLAFRWCERPVIRKVRLIHTVYIADTSIRKITVPCRSRE